MYISVDHAAICYLSNKAISPGRHKAAGSQKRTGNALMRKSIILAFTMAVLASMKSAPVLPQESLIYVPVNPCRIVDTRVAGGAIPANTSRKFLVSGMVTGQGGTAAGCQAPRQETKPLAISAYVVAVPATGSSAGVLTAYPSDQVAPAVGEGSTVNFAAGEIVGNTSNITLCEPSDCPSDGEFAILARSTNQHVVVDAQGYFYPSTARTMVLKDGNGVRFGKVLS